MVEAQGQDSNSEDQNILDSLFPLPHKDVSDSKSQKLPRFEPYKFFWVVESKKWSLRLQIIGRLYVEFGVLPLFLLFYVIISGGSRF
jgi:hypothetical protein